LTSAERMKTGVKLTVVKAEITSDPNLIIVYFFININLFLKQAI